MVILIEVFKVTTTLLPIPVENVTKEASFIRKIYQTRCTKNLMEKILKSEYKYVYTDIYVQFDIKIYIYHMCKNKFD